MASENEIYCAKPWSHIVLMHNNRYKPCCRFHGSFPLDPLQTDVLQTKDLKRIREDMMSQKLLPECSKCHFEEKTCNESLRTRYNSQTLKHIQKDTPELRYLEIFFSNLCDLECLGCSSQNSSKWIKTEKKLNQQPHSLQKINIKNINIDLKKTYHLKITGGEPLLSNEHTLFCKNILQTGAPEKIRLSFFTNGHHKAPLEVLGLWKKTKHCEIFFSIDGLEETNNYFRHGSNWKRFIETTHWFYNELKNHKNIKLSFITTVNIFNVGSLMQLDEFLDREFPDFGRFRHPLTSPEFLAPQNLPVEVKEKIISQYKVHLKEFPFKNKSHKNFYQAAINTLKQPPKMDWDQVLKKIQIYDLARNTTSKDILTSVLGI